jgi:hypothetical protein
VYPAIDSRLTRFAALDTERPDAPVVRQDRRRHGFAEFHASHEPVAAVVPASSTGTGPQ